MLFTAVNELKDYISVNVNSKLESVKPFITLAEQKYILPILGKDQYIALVNALAAGLLTLSDSQKALLDQVRRPLANLAYYHYIPQLNVQVSDSGIRIASTDTLKQAFQWQVNELRSAYADAGFEAIETLLAFLEENKTSYPLWTSSSSYTIHKSLFISNATEFQECYNIHSSRRLYLAMIPVMRFVEEYQVKPLVGKDLFLHLKNEIKARTETEASLRILPLIRSAVASFTVSRSITQLALELNPETGIALRRIASNKDNVNEKQVPEAEKLGFIKEEAWKTGETHLNALKIYLEENKNDYPAYRDYVPSSIAAPHFTNDPLTKIYGAL